MFLPVQSESQKALKGLALAFSLALGIIAAGPAVQAQSTDAGSMGMDLLPPEVVPLDPTAASQLSATQAESRQMSGSDAAAPGLVAGDNNNGMQSAQDFRKSAFESLYNQGQMPQQQQQQPVWRAGQVSYGNGAPAMPMNGMQSGMPNMPGAPGMQQPGFAPPGSPQFGQYPSTPGMTNGALYSAHQTQTLSGAPKSKPIVKDVRKGGFSHALSAMAGFGAGAITHGALMNPQSAMMGLGMFGATMTGFGVRNASRF
ncbi:MAG: hypothetical protein U0105_10680 [Candidatus Obscuribacterales bacterium]